MIVIAKIKRISSRIHIPFFFLLVKNARAILMSFLVIRFNINYHRAAASRAIGNSTPSPFNRWIDLKHA